MKLRTLLCCLLLFLVGSKSPQSLAAQEEEQASTSRAWIDEARLNNGSIRFSQRRNVEYMTGP